MEGPVSASLPNAETEFVLESPFFKSLQGILKSEDQLCPNVDELSVIQGDRLQEVGSRGLRVE